ncbi:MAG: glycosyltransferase family 39 protein [Anaerolineae bacterium]|nr:glycosyltransferase family 39 protein [Anaerolineae bacterium]
MIAVLFLVLCLRFTQRTIDGWDPLAYLYAAERLAEGRPFAFCHPYNHEIGPYFTMAGFNVGGGSTGCLYLNYPLGFPLVLLLAKWLLPMQQAMLIVPAVFGALGAMVTYWLGRLLLGARAGLTAAILLALAPPYLQFSTSLWSDLPVTTMLLFGLAILVWADRQIDHKRQVMAGWLAGMMLGWAIFGRYSAAVFLLPVVAYLLAGRTLGSQLKSRLVRSLALSLGLAFLGIAVFNTAFYGGPLKTPYSVEHGWYAWPKFSLQYAFGSSPVGSASLVAIVQAVWEGYGPLILVGFVGFLVSSPRLRVLMISGVGVFVAFYGLYAFPARGINARFALPLLPLVALSISAGLWYVHRVPRWVTGIWRGIVGLIIAIVLVVPLPAAVGHLADRNQATRTYVENILATVDVTELDAVILAYDANDAIAFYTGRIPFYYRRVQRPPDVPDTGIPYFEPTLVSAVTALLNKGIPVYYLLESEPSYWDSYAILDRNFRLNPVTSESSLYRITQEQVLRLQSRFTSRPHNVQLPRLGGAGGSCPCC